MELLNPPIHGLSPESLSGSSSSTNSRRGFDRRSSSQLPVILEDDVSKRVHVHVAIGKSAEKEKRLLYWTFKRFEGKEVALLHVYQPSFHIPTHLGKVPASKASSEVLSSYRKYEKEQILKFLQQTYSTICSTAKVAVSIVVIEADKVKTGIVDLIYQHGITRLVMGALPKNCVKMKRSSSKANYAAKYAPSFCEIWFISKGKHVWTRETDERKSSRFSRGSSPVSSLESARSWSFQLSKHKSIHPDCHYSPYGTSSSNVSGYTSSDRVMSHVSDLKVNDETLHAEFSNVKMEEEVSRNLVQEDLLNLRKLQAEAREAISKAKELGSSLEREVKLRKEAEDALRTTREEQQKISQDREELNQELLRARRNIALLDSWVQEAKSWHDDASGELKLVQESIATLRLEKQQIQRQKMEALRWLERWRIRGRGGSTKSGLVGFVNELPKLAELSLSDLNNATCNFCTGFKIGEGDYGCVYKGEMLGRTVAIRKIHTHNMQGESEFQQELKVLGKLQHPHLVSLLGVCPEALSIVYEYLPNGNLEENLTRKSNLLTWKIRVQIIANIASALCFLHSIKPKKVVYGNLTPRKILLDSELSCKISDFGICRLITDDNNLRCSSMRWSTGPNLSFPYIDPEFQRVGILTPKSDVYSLGLIILQLLTGRFPVGLVGEVRRAFSSGKLGAIVDSSAGEWPTFVVRRLVGIALDCCELIGRDRPDLTPSLVMELEQLHVPQERPVPAFFMCPILQEIMHDPQVAADGFTYEGEAMREWLQSGKDTSPMTNLRLTHLHLTPNHAVRLAIHDWLCES